MEVPRNYQIQPIAKKDVIQSSHFKLRTFEFERPFPVCILNTIGDLSHKHSLSWAACLIREKGIVLLTFDSPEIMEGIRSGKKIVLKKIGAAVSRGVANELAMFSDLYYSWKELQRKRVKWNANPDIQKAFNNPRSITIPINEIRSLTCHAGRKNYTPQTIIKIEWEQNKTTTQKILLYSEDRKLYQTHHAFPYLLFLKRWAFELTAAKKQFLHHTLGPQFRLILAMFEKRLQGLRGQRRIKNKITKLQREFVAEFEKYMTRAKISPESVSQAGMQKTKYWLQHVRNESAFDVMPKIYGFDS